jgi:serine/threonine protein kinase
MGLVFEAEDTDLLRPVALKVIRPELAASPQAMERFTLEARAMAALKHEHVVTIYQVGQQRGVAFLAMEYLQGVSLHRWLERGRKPSLDLMLRLGREMAAGLAAAHSRGVIHRDIKPANIWLEAPIGRVKILDFGLARSESRDVQITNPGTTVGTPAYMAPEQARGERADASSDLFSLGCVLYQLCTGKLPFPGATVMAVLTSLSVDTPSPPGDQNPTVPPALDALIMGLLAKDPADRPASAEVVVQEIKSIERELLAERQKAELSPAVPLPVIDDPGKPTPAGIAGKPGAPGPAVETRAVRRALALAAAAVLALAVGSMAVVMRWRDVRTTVAVPPVPVPIPSAAIESSRVVPESGPRPRPSPPGPPPSSNPPASVPPRKPVGPPAEPKEMVREAPRAKPVAEAPREAAPEHDRRGREIPEKPGAREPLKWAQKPADWGEVIDPDSDCQVLSDGAKNRLTILVPGTAHLLSAEIGRMNAPRILHEITGEFEVRVRVTGTSHPGGKATTNSYSPYHGAGILLWQDPENYVRLEIAADLRKGRVFPYANFELRQAGRLAFSEGYKIVDGASYLRLKRRAGEIHGAFSSDGSHWTPLPSLIANLNDRVKVGVVVVNSASKSLKAGFEELQVTSAGR